MLVCRGLGPDIFQTIQTTLVHLRHRKPALSVRWWQRRASWWWSPPRSRGRWRTPSAPRPTAAWSRSRWGRPPRRGCRIPLGREGSRAGKKKRSVSYSAAQWFVCLDLDCPLSGLEIIRISSEQGDSDHSFSRFLTCLGGVCVQVPAHDVLYPLRCEDQQNWKY